MTKKDKTTEQVYQLPNKGQIDALLKLASRTKNKTAELNGELGQAVANAVEHHHVHRGALASTRKFFDMRKNPAKLAEHWAHFMDYMNKSGVMEIIDSVEELPFEERRDADEPEGKVTNIDEHRAEA